MRKSNLVFPALIIILLMLIDWYVFQGVKTLAASFPHQGEIIQYGYWSFVIALMVSVFLGLKARSNGKFNLFGRVVLHAFLTIMVTKLVFLLVLIAEDIYRAGFAIVNVIGNGPSDTLLPERSKLMSQVGVFIAGVPLVSFVYGIARGKYDYKVHRHTLYFDDLPEAFDGFTITQISDVHAGSLKNSKAVRKGIDLINAQNADVFVFTGDLVNNQASEMEPWLDHFSAIHAPYGKFAILGNHDYGDYIPWNNLREKQENLERLKQHHETLGHRLLLNESIAIRKAGQSITLTGVENWGQGFTKKGDLAKALTHVDRNAFKILLSHDPSHWDAQVKNHHVKIHLTLAGHTHGMQVGIEMAGLRWSPVKYRYPNWAGLASHNNRYLNVNRGFGFIGFEGRVGIWPEITVIELRKRYP